MKALARWRFRVWTNRLNRRRAIWNSCDSETRYADWLHWEAKVTEALRKRTKWRKRVGVVPVPPKRRPVPRPDMEDPGQ